MAKEKWKADKRRSEGRHPLLETLSLRGGKGPRAKCLVVPVTTLRAILEEHENDWLRNGTDGLALSDAVMEAIYAEAENLDGPSPNEEDE